MNSIDVIYHNILQEVLCLLPITTADAFTSCYLSLNIPGVAVSLAHQAFKARKQKQFPLYTRALVVYTHLTSRWRFFPLCPTQRDTAVEHNHAFTSSMKTDSSSIRATTNKHFHYLLCSRLT